MLKIKDNVDLKELEKFGFKLNQYNEYRKEICGGRRGQCFELIIFGKREFRGEDKTIYGFAYGADGDGEEDIIDNTLYDLIKADLVEKVKEK
jgi:hypothetical protein